MRTAIGPIAKRMWAVLLLTFKIFGRIEAEQRAASFAYYALFSMIPLVALLLSLGTILAPDTDTVHQALTEFVPISSAQQDVVFKMVADLQKKRGSISIVSFFILAWTSLRFFQSLVRAVNRAWHTIPNPWWQMPIKNFAMIAVVATGLGLGLLVPALAQGTVNALSSIEQFIATHVSSKIHLAATLQILDWTRFIGGALVLFYTFLMLYKLAPRKKVLFRQVWLPALVVTFIVQFCQIAFVDYLPRFVDYGSVYGTIGGLMLLLLWVYVSGLIIIWGGCMCAAMARLAAVSPTPASSGN